MGRVALCASDFQFVVRQITRTLEKGEESVQE